LSEEGIRQGLKERAATWIINRVAGLANSKVDIARLQAIHNANEGRISRMTLTDINKSFYFRVKDGKLQLLSGAEKLDGGFDLTVDTLVSMASGKQKRMDPGTGKIFSVEFTPIDAVTQGLVRIWGEAASNDLLLFAKAVYGSIWGQLKTEINATATAAANGTNGANGHA